jgi:uncharacterized protein (TIGR03066 family)
VVLVGLVFLGMVTVVPAGSDHARRIIGVWEKVKDPGITYEFTKDGKVKMTERGKADPPGTYRVKGDELTITVTIGDKPETQIAKIKKLTDNELVIQLTGKKEIEFKRVKSIQGGAS